MFDSFTYILYIRPSPTCFRVLYCAGIIRCLTLMVYFIASGFGMQIIVSPFLKSRKSTKYAYLPWYSGKFFEIFLYNLFSLHKQVRHVAGRISWMEHDGSNDHIGRRSGFGWHVHAILREARNVYRPDSVFHHIRRRCIGQRDTCHHFLSAQSDAQRSEYVSTA